MQTCDMDYISPNNLFSISSCDLNTKFNDRCHADWSKTNLISIVTLDGIYILKPNLEKLNAPFEIELIRNPANKFKHEPFEKDNISLDELWNTLDNKRYMETYLDPALSTITSKLTIETYPRRYRSAKWSPIIDTYPKQCMLTVLTIDYQLLIFNHKHGVWALGQDLSQIYDKTWLQTELASNLKDTSYEGIRYNAHSLSFSVICWKEYRNSDQLFLFAITLAGDLVIWQLCLSSDDIQNYQKNIVNLSVRYILRTGLGFINSMQFCEDLLITTSRNGQVSLYDLSSIFEELVRHRHHHHHNHHPHEDTKSRQHGSLLGIIDIVPSAVLWHQDNIEVTDFYLQSLSPVDFRIVLAKATNICWCTIHYQPKSGSEPSTLAISDSFSAIDGLDPEVSLHQTPASWLRPAGDRRAVLIADDGSFFLLEFLDDQQDTSPNFNAIRTGKIDLTDMIPRGLCCSPNGHLISMISSVTFLVDPLKIPAPTKLILLPTQNDRTFFTECLRNLLDESWLASKNIKSPVEVRDSLDCILSMLPHLNSNQYSRFHVMLKEEMAALVGGGCRRSTNAFQFVKLKIISFILLKLLGHENYKKTDRLQDNLEEKIYNLILLNNIEQILDATLSEARNFFDQQELSSPAGGGGTAAAAGDPRVLLSNEQVNSIRNCMSWLDKSSDGQQIRDKYRSQFEKLIECQQYKQVPYETCSICQCDIPFESYKYGTCTNKHQFVRCSRSLLVLDLSKQDRLQCADCKRSYMAKLIWPTSNLWLCLYCQ